MDRGIVVHEDPTACRLQRATSASGVPEPEGSDMNKKLVLHRETIQFLLELSAVEDNDPPKETELKGHCR